MNNLKTEDLRKILPISLVEVLNNTNKKLDKYKKYTKLYFKEGKITSQGKELKIVKILYNFKDTSFFFEVKFDLINEKTGWSYLPHSKNSTKHKTYPFVDISNPKLLVNLQNELDNWIEHLSYIENLENPIDYFNQDDFLKFYANELIEEFPIEDSDYKYPLKESRQVSILNLIELQQEFINSELENPDNSEEKNNDLTLSKGILDKVKEELPRLTISEVKTNLAITVASIKKWCENPFKKFLTADTKSGYEISRTLGSFIGGVFGVSKIE